MFVLIKHSGLAMRSAVLKPLPFRPALLLAKAVLWVLNQTNKTAKRSFGGLRVLRLFNLVVRYLPYQKAPPIGRAF